MSSDRLFDDEQDAEAVKAPTAGENRDADEDEEEDDDQPEESKEAREDSEASEASPEEEESEAELFESKTRQFPAIRTVVETDHAEELALRLQQVHAFYQQDKISQRTKEWLKIDEADKENHFRLLQWYGCRLLSLSRGYLTFPKRFNANDYELTEEDFNSAEDHDKQYEDHEKWSVASFAVLDANHRAFPFLIEYHDQDGDSDMSAAFIYTCKSSTDDPNQLGPDVCVGQIAAAGEYSQIIVNMKRLRAALPHFVSSYKPHNLADTIHSQSRLHYCFHTSMDITKNGASYQSAIFPLPDDLSDASPLSPDKHSARLSQWHNKVGSFYDSLTTEEFLQNQLEVIFGEAAETLFGGALALSFTENQPIELRLQLTVEVLTRLPSSEAKAFTSAALPPISFHLDNGSATSASERPHKQQRLSSKQDGDQSDDSDYNQDDEEMAEKDNSLKNSNESSKDSSHTAVPGTTGKNRKRCATSDETSTSSSSKWPHSDLIWGAAGRPLPDDLERLIAEYMLEELELIGLPFSQFEYPSPVYGDPFDFQSSCIVYGTPDDDGTLGVDD